jgi:membrane protease subunit HflK|tara:strand:+ start:4360 stop:5520 length:1161 start_codon:yes stop_codon:yes gene_type:complete
MAWNEPGNNNDRDPWGQKPSGGNEGPPDLDEALKKLQKKINGIFGGGGSSKNDSSGMGFIFSFVVILAVCTWLIHSIFIVKEAERAVVQRFGAYKETLGPGWHFAPALIDKYQIHDVSKIREHPAQGKMLTQDENIVELSIVVQYRIDDLQAYLFNVSNAEMSLAEATDSAMRHVLGSSTMNDVLTDKKEDIRQGMREQINKIMKPYQTGLLITDLLLKPARAPAAVQDAFDDAIKAQEDKEKLINEAEEYKQKQVPIAEGNGQRIKEEARAYKSQVTNRAYGDVAQFEKMLPEYTLAPEVTRKRLYIETMEEVFANTNKVLIDEQSGGNLLYLPVDKLIKPRKTTGKDDMITEDYSLESEQSAKSTSHSSRSSSSRSSTRFSRGQ